MRQFLALLLTTLFLLSSSGCGAGQVLGPTLTPTLTSTATPTLTPTATATPTPTPIPTPSVDAGLRPENAATQTYENGIWVVKNADGQVTATWSEDTGEWSYVTENIVTKQIIIGYDVDPAVIEPYLGPLPPDDPSTHFIDPDTGKRIGYGIGPEKPFTAFGSAVGTYSGSDTLVFARFRGVTVVPLPYGWDGFEAVQIIEIPQTVDTSIIWVMSTGREYFFSFIGVPDDSMYIDNWNLISYKQWGGVSGITLANENLIGKMVAVSIGHDTAHFFKEEKEIYYEFALIVENMREAILNYLAGKSTQIPSREEYKYSSGSSIYVPESQLPNQ